MVTPQEYRGFLIHGTAKMIHPFDPCHYPAGIICKPGPSGSIIEVAGVSLPSFSLELPELAEWFGLELCRIAVDECFTEQ